MRRRDHRPPPPPESLLTNVERGRLREYALSGVLADYHEPAELGGDFTGFWAGLPLAETELNRQAQHRLVFQRRRAWVQMIGSEADGELP